MKELLEYILKGILGEADFRVDEEVDGDFVRLSIKVEPEVTGIVIGKGGSTIKALRNILRVRAIRHKLSPSISFTYIPDFSDEKARGMNFLVLSPV